MADNELRKILELLVKGHEVHRDDLNLLYDRINKLDKNAYEAVLALKDQKAAMIDDMKTMLQMIFRIARAVPDLQLPEDIQKLMRIRQQEEGPVEPTGRMEKLSLRHTN